MTIRATTMLGFAIVGCGMIARFHARALAEVPGARVVALVSRNSGQRPRSWPTSWACTATSTPT